MRARRRSPRCSNAPVSPPPPDFWPRQGVGWAVIISRRPAPLPLLIIAWALQAQSNPNAPSDLTAAIVGGSIAPEWGTPAEHAASIPGTPQVGETLTADIPNVVDANVLHRAASTLQWAVGDIANAGIDGNGLDNATYTYQRAVGVSDIDGVTSPSYALTSDEEGDTVQVQVSFTDDEDFSETATSVAMATVEATPVANNPATGLPTISGTPQVEQTLTADTSAICDEDGLSNVSCSYQWIAGGADIGATAPSLALIASQMGHDIQIRVTFTDNADNSESLTSTATATVAAKPTPLTTSFGNVPDSHDGGNEFTFDRSFSENIKAGYERVRDDAFTISDGDITRAQRKPQGSNQTWTSTVEPAGDRTVSITLPQTTDCNDTGAIRTCGERALSHSTSISVAGPGYPLTLATLPEQTR